MDIEWINTTAATVDYSTEAIAEYEAGHDDGIEKYILRFETEHNLSGGENIGGIIVYSDTCVYDYENFRGWIK